MRIVVIGAGIVGAASARALASAVSIYSAHMGNVPSALDLLTAVASTAQGQTAGPFMAYRARGHTGQRRQGKHGERGAHARVIRTENQSDQPLWRGVVIHGARIAGME